MSLADRTRAALETVTEAMDAGEYRSGQGEMAAAVADAITERRHLVVQAGTGTGKSLAYLLPAVLSGRRTVVATATKALQDQLADKDLPMLAAALGRDVDWAVLKGRSNYLCRQRLDEASGPQTQLGLDGVAEATGGGAVPQRWLDLFGRFADESTTGDRAELSEEPPGWVWSAVSVGPRECPGAQKCPRGEDCFAETARRRAAGADVVVVNSHLYGLNLAARGGILPPHEIAILDEAHEIEDTLVHVRPPAERWPGSRDVSDHRGPDRGRRHRRRVRSRRSPTRLRPGRRGGDALPQGCPRGAHRHAREPPGRDRGGDRDARGVRRSGFGRRRHPKGAGRRGR
ncbi:MAG: DEAD/DEAH box helicase [Microthrixaceae bacterium]